MSSRLTMLAAMVALGSLPQCVPQLELEPEPEPEPMIPASLARMADLVAGTRRHDPRPMTDEERVHHENATAAHSAKEAARKARRAARNAKGMQSL